MPRCIRFQLTLAVIQKWVTRPLPTFVSLSDDANGTVVADAVYIVKVEALTDAVTWVPALPSSGSY